MLLETVSLSKRFGSFYALKDVCFSIGKGKIHGLVGENGAGKSTLIKILSGVYKRTSGDILIDGVPVSLSTPLESRAAGISVIHQDRNLVPSFNGVENVWLGLKTPKKGASVDFRLMRRTVEQSMAEYGIDLPLDKMARDLSPAEKTMLEITRAVMNGSKLLIMDEPTASLTDKETAKLFSIIHRLHQDGTAILYVSHRLDEIFALTSSITVLRNGQVSGTVETAETDRDSLIKLMTGSWTARKQEHSKSFGKELFSIDSLSTRDGIVKDVSLKAHEGEILGLFGLGGSGRTETLEAVYGLRELAKGTVRMSGEKLSHISPERSLKRGIVLVHEDRRGHSLVMNRAVKDNIVLSAIDRFVKKGFYRGKEEKKAALGKMSELGIQARSPGQVIWELSGGNQQKVVFARALMTSPKVFLCDEPTQAVDVKTRQEIHTLLRALADQGSTIVFVTSDLEEMLEVADTITIISDGRTRETLVNDALTSEEVLGCCYKER